MEEVVEEEEVEEEEVEEEEEGNSWLAMDRSSARAVCWRPHNQQHEIILLTNLFRAWVGCSS